MDGLIERRFDHVISLCGKAREVCPEFPERPCRVHWSVPDPALAADTDQASHPAFQRTAGDIATRICYLLPPCADTGGPAMTTLNQFASVRYIVDDVQAGIDFYITHLGFTLHTSAAAAFADITRGSLRLLLSGPVSSGARAAPDDATAPGRNRIHLIVDDPDNEIYRLRAAGLSFRSNVVAGPGGCQILISDPAGNLIELFQPARPPTATSRHRGGPSPARFVEGQRRGGPS